MAFVEANGSVYFTDTRVLTIHDRNIQKLNEHPGHYQIMYELGAGCFAAKMMDHALYFAYRATKAKPLVRCKPCPRWISPRFLEGCIGRKVVERALIGGPPLSRDLHWLLKNIASDTSAPPALHPPYTSSSLPMPAAEEGRLPALGVRPRVNGPQGRRAPGYVLFTGRARHSLHG
jgi:hypothetical protein